MKKSMENLPDTITLNKTSAYALSSSDDEYRSSIKGYYKDLTIANVKAKKSGWYESDGKVDSVVVFTDGNQLFELTPLGNYSDVDEQVRKDAFESITKKLSKEEIAYLKEHHNFKID